MRIPRVILGLALDEVGFLCGQAGYLHIWNTAALSHCDPLCSLHEKGLARLIEPDITLYGCSRLDIGLW